MVVRRKKLSLFIKLCLFTVGLGSYAGMAHAANIGYAINSTTPIAIVQSNTNTNATGNVATSNTSLPNAYELVKKLETQQLEMARLAGQVEKLQLQVDTLTQSNTQAENESSVTKSSKQALKAELLSELAPLIKAQVAEQVDLRSTPINSNAAIRRPYLIPTLRNGSEATIDANQPAMLTNMDIAAVANAQASDSGSSASDSTSNTETTQRPKANPLTQTADSNQAQNAYFAAYSALKEEGAQAGIEKMQAFIAAYPNHSLAPNAHYWLGEFYLKDTPPNVKQAQIQFLKVIKDYNDYPSNDKQSKALYRLATFAKSDRQVTQAKKYVDILISTYPESNEAKLAQKSKW